MVCGFRQPIPGYRRVTLVTRDRKLAVFVLAALMVAPSFGQGVDDRDPDGPPPPEPLTEAVFSLPVEPSFAAEIDAMVTRLGSPLYDEREKAMQDLVQVGLQAFGALRRAYRASSELEVQLRIEEIVREAYLNHHVYDRNGFLGISMRPYVAGQPVAVRDPKNPRGQQTINVADLPEGLVGAVVIGITDNTAASHAELAPGDVIVAINDAPLEGDGQAVTQSLSGAIRRNPPGATIKVTAFRCRSAESATPAKDCAAERFSVDVTLGRCPPQTARSTNVLGTSELVRKMSQRFPGWWLEHFNPEPPDEHD